MSKLTVPQHLTHSTIFRVWLEAINGIIDEELEIYDVLDTKAPIAHATQGTMYGVGTPEMYGHLKLVDEINDAFDASTGTAVSPKAVADAIAVFSARLDAMEEAFYASLQELRTDMQEQIDELNEAVAGKAPIYHASSEETYGKGNAILYGHLKLSEARSPLFGVDDGVAATPSAVQSAYDDGVAYVDSFNIDYRFESLNRRVSTNEENIQELDDRLNDVEEEIDELQEQLLVGLETLFFSESLSVDSSKLRYGAFVFKDSLEDATLTLNDCRPHFRISIANESNNLLSVVPDAGFTLNSLDLPVVLGRGDTLTLIQNPISNSGIINWTILARETMMESTTERTLSSICTINMASEKSESIEITGPTSIEFNLGQADASGHSEYSEKSLLFISATSNSRLTWPQGIVWMNAEEPPVWGLASGETLFIKAYQFGSRLFLEQKHNSHIVPGLDPDVVDLL